MVGAMMQRKILKAVMVVAAIVGVTNSVAVAQCKPVFSAVRIGEANPSSAEMFFRITSTGLFRAKVDVNSVPETSCSVTLKSRLGINAEPITSVRTLATKPLTKSFVRFTARRMPAVKRRNGSLPELNLQATVSCTGEADVVTNVYARYLDCGFGPSASSLTATSWLNLLRSRLS